ncbi:alpha/beta fold hydrolase [Nocardioides sp.]|uniref:alpha/beta fold hydrolase n=1 Tax=Nocardioides sp. TaxID=35761 RepID=UPI002ED3DA65
MRAREPDRAGYVERDGVRVYYECFGEGDRTIVFVPADVYVTSRMWKAQVPYLARRHRVVVIDPRGNGRSDRPLDPAAYSDLEYDADLIAVMDELGIERAVLAGLCMSAYYSLLSAARHPDRAEGVVAIAAWAAEGTPRRDRGNNYLQAVEEWESPFEGGDGWWQFNRELWLTDWPRWPAFFFSQIINDSHSTKIYEDLVGWACESTGPAQVAAQLAPLSAGTPEATAELLARIECPGLVIHGNLDACQVLARGAHIARLAGAELLALGGSGHVPVGRDPIAVNHAIEDFMRRIGGGEIRRVDGPAVVRARLSARSDATDAGVPSGPSASVVVVAASGDHAAAWQRQLPALGRHVRFVITDDPAAALAEAAAPAVVVVPPGHAEVVEPLLAQTDRVEAVLLVEAPVALAEQPGLLEYFFERLPDTPPSSVVRALVDAEPGRVPVVAVVDDHRQALPLPADAIVTVEGGVPAPLERPRPGRRRERSVLFLSSPIGLGHVRRDLAIADALRRQVPGLRIDWLSQSPVTEFLSARGEQVHPASAWLATESAHIESEAGEHDLHAFQAIRRMDEILVNNFHVFDDLVAEREYDAWVGDEAWDLDHFLHENPRLKRAPFVWLTDFVGWLPMPDGGEREAALAADYNAEMVEHVARYPGLRDRSVFVGDPDDVVPESLGPGLPGIREWTEQHFAFSGYVMGERPSHDERDRLREKLGYGPDETVCVVSVGGSGVGRPLLERVADAYDAAKSRVPSLRMMLVTGPRIDPACFQRRSGVQVEGFVPDLDLHHAACDVAVVQGGLSTTMELTAAGRPFLYFPLRHHFEQQFHVRHRLERHGAGRAMDYETADPDTIADALVAEVEHPRRYAEVPSDGADRAAALVAEVL